MTSDPKASGWSLDPQIERDTMPIGDMALCRILLMRDANYPWLLLVPRRHGASELTDLDTAEQVRLIAETAEAAGVLKEMTNCDKINLAALGNVVPQLHVHVIARRRNDPAWPKPVWNVVPARPYEPAEAEQLIGTVRQRLKLVR
jgi:diadenosine tetraphosphate (Ap4A) HIT family hydrolase